MMEKYAVDEVESVTPDAGTRLNSGSEVFYQVMCAFSAAESDTEEWTKVARVGLRRRLAWWMIVAGPPLT